MQLDRFTLPRDPANSLDRSRERQLALRFASETDAEQWEHHGRVDDERADAFEQPARTM